MTFYTCPYWTFKNTNGWPEPEVLPDSPLLLWAQGGHDGTGYGRQDAWHAVQVVHAARVVDPQLSLQETLYTGNKMYMFY